MTEETTGLLIAALQSTSHFHSRESHLYKLFEVTAKDIIQSSSLKDAQAGKLKMGVFGEVKFPYYKMGAIDSLDLFGLDELMIFSFYWANKNNYKNVADIGANLGLHSILMSRCGWRVNSYEPDPVHLKLLNRNLQLNDVSSVHVNEMAVSDKEGMLEFIRVKGNTTGSHLAGSKENPYGELDKFEVKVASIKKIMKESDLIKMDVEGHEAQIITSTELNDWKNTDVMLEVGTPQNAEIIFNHLKKLGVNCFAQKIGWSKVKSLADVPTSYKEGSLFISVKDKMFWGA